MMTAIQSRMPVTVEDRRWPRHPSSSLYPRARTPDQRLDLVAAGHRRVTGTGHRQRAVCRAVLHRRGDVLAAEQPVDEAGGEAVAAADPVQDLQPGPVGRLGEGAVGPRDRAPVVDRGTAYAAQRG